MSFHERDLRGLFARLRARGAPPIVCLAITAAFHPLTPQPPVRILLPRHKSIDAVEEYLHAQSLPGHLVELSTWAPDPYATNLLRQLYGMSLNELMRRDEVARHMTYLATATLPILQDKLLLAFPGDGAANAAIGAPEFLMACGDMKEIEWSSNAGCFTGVSTTGQAASINLTDAAWYCDEYHSADKNLNLWLDTNPQYERRIDTLEPLIEQRVIGQGYRIELDPRRCVYAITHPRGAATWCTPARLAYDMGSSTPYEHRLPAPSRSYYSAHTATSQIDAVTRRMHSGEYWLVSYDTRRSLWIGARTGKTEVSPL